MHMLQIVCGSSGCTLDEEDNVKKVQQVGADIGSPNSNRTVTRMPVAAAGNSLSCTCSRYTRPAAPVVARSCFVIERGAWKRIPRRRGRQSQLLVELTGCLVSCSR